MEEKEELMHEDDNRRVLGRHRRPCQKSTLRHNTLTISIPALRRCLVGGASEAAAIKGTKGSLKTYDEGPTRTM